MSRPRLELHRLFQQLLQSTVVTEYNTDNAVLGHMRLGSATLGTPLTTEVVHDFSNNVYFQPPPTIQMHYPCIVYRRSDSVVSNADNIKYRKYKRYSVTVIDYDPDSTIPDKVEELRYCSFGRFYTKDNLNHWSFELYY